MKKRRKSKRRPRSYVSMMREAVKRRLITPATGMYPEPHELAELLRRK